ncbi:MAG: hypothetical protein HYZ18_15150 [Pseudogulbenkiania sp.]|nr:hypothetical protein [Pseudogulbenkiania sp.]
MTRDDPLDAVPDGIPLKELRPIPANDVVIAEAHHLVYHVQLQPGVTLDDCLCADAWRNAAFKFHVHDQLEIHPADDSYFAILLVRECAREFAHVSLLYKVDFPRLHANVDDIPLGYHVDFLGVQRLFGVFHGTQLLKHGLTTRGEAVQWLRETLH